MAKTVTFISAADMAKIDQPCNVISIGGYADETDWFASTEAHKRVLKLEFDDVDGFVGSQGFHPFTTDHAKLILDFADACGEESIIVHCQAGMSRSAATAKFLADKLGYQLDLAHPGCLGHANFYNRHVYKTLEGSFGGDLSSYYRELELSQGPEY